MFMFTHKKSSQGAIPKGAYLNLTTVVMTEGNTMKNQDNFNTKKPMTQCDKTLEYMKSKGGITPIDALSEFGCFSLAQRIYDLKKRGYSIITERINKDGMFGKVSFAKYRLNNAGDANG